MFPIMGSSLRIYFLMGAPDWAPQDHGSILPFQESEISCPRGAVNPLLSFATLLARALPGSSRLSCV